MSDLDRAVDARIDAHRPEQVPPFEAIQARRSRRNRTRAAGGALLSVLAVAGSAFGASAVGSGPDRLPSYTGPAEPPPTTYVLRYEQGHPYDAEADQAAVAACTALPGVGEVSEEQTLPPKYIVTVAGGEAAEAFTDCALNLSGVSLSFLPTVVPWADALWEPPAFADRVRLPSCGAFEIVPGDVPPEAIACMNRAVAGPEGAELALSLQPIDGDSVIAYIRVLPGDQGVEIFEDGTRNQNGWILASCKGFDPETGLGDDCQTTQQYPAGGVSTEPGTAQPEAPPLPPPYIERCFGAGPYQAADGYAGVALDQAAALAEQDGLRFREVGRDGECLNADFDLRDDRISVAVADGTVVWAARF